MNILAALLGTNPPYTSLQVQRIEGGFICVVPPGPPVAADDGNSAAGSLFLWLGGFSEPKGKSSPVDAREPTEFGLPGDQNEVGFNWPEATCPVGSTFQISKIRRAGPKGDILKRTAFFLTYHCASQESAHNGVVFARSSVMEHFRDWLAYEPLSPEEQIFTQGGGVLALKGMRVNEMLGEGDEGTFKVYVTSGEDGAATLIARKLEPPQFQIGLSDVGIIHYVTHHLGQDAEGFFLSRVWEAYLEFGPRVEGGDDGDEPVLPVSPDPSQESGA